jgi:hypothetical protein
MHGLSARGPSKGISAFLPGFESIAVQKNAVRCAIQKQSKAGVLPLIGHLKNEPGEGVPGLQTLHSSFRDKPMK